MKPVTKKSQGFKRDRPDLPSELEPARPDIPLFTDHAEIAIMESRIQDLSRPDLRAGNFRLDSCVLERVQIAGAQFGAALWKDVRLVECDLANVRVHRMSLVRAEFIDCRLTGFSVTASDWQDVLLQNSDVRYAHFQAAKFRNCEFDGCNWEEASLQHADLSGCVLRSCALARADFRGARLQNTDFRTSEIEGLEVGANDVRGAIVDPAQAMILARLLGLHIV